MWTLLLSKLSQPGVFIDRRQVDSGEVRIGRSAASADWVIADPEGHLSRHHCTVAAIGLDLFVIDTSTNGVALNDPSRRVAPQQPVAIRVRDRLLLGDYAIEVATEGAGAGVSLQPPPPPPAYTPGAAGLTQPDAWFDGSADPIWGVGAPSAEVHDFLGSAMHDFLAPPPGGAFGAPPPSNMWGGGGLSEAFSKPILAVVTPVDNAFSIPEDWAAPASSAAPATAWGNADPFAAPAAPGGGVDPFAAPAGLDPFAAAAGAPGSGVDPFAIPVDPDPFAPQISPAVDPFAGFAPPSGTSPFVDPLHDPFAPSTAPDGDDPFALPTGAPASDPFALPGGTPAPDPFSAAPDPLPVDPFADGPSNPSINPFADYPPAAGSDPLAGFVAPAAPKSPPQSGPSDAAGWAAFCEGAGLTQEEMRGSPDAMRRLGTLYRQVVLGLSDLIQDRAAFKDEFRVERTQLSFGRNNPLKHLPALESAKLLLGDPLPGFMPAEDAVRSAFEDVKKHQLAMLAGVQHALTAVFERLAPAEVERIMKKAAATRKGLPFGRGVNPWTVYQTIFDALRLDAASNVNSVMSVAFREGYEAFLKNAK